METLENDENRKFLAAFGTKQIDALGVGTFLWHQSLATDICRLISYRFQIVPASYER